MAHTLISGAATTVGTPGPGNRIVIKRIVITQTTGSAVYIYTDLDEGDDYDAGEEIVILYCPANVPIDIPNINLVSGLTTLMDSSNVTKSEVQISAHSSALGCVWWDEVSDDAVHYQAS